MCSLSSSVATAATERPFLLDGCGSLPQAATAACSWAALAASVRTSEVSDSAFAPQRSMSRRGAGATLVRCLPFCCCCCGCCAATSAGAWRGCWLAADLSVRAGCGCSCGCTAAGAAAGEVVGCSATAPAGNAVRLTGSCAGTAGSAGL
jgi:hypothetical protein